MNRVFATACAALVLSASAFAQSEAPRTTTTPPAVAKPSDTNKTTAAPVDGKNSFTEAQVVERLGKNGYMNATNVMKDDKSGVWHATAMKAGKSTSVDVDYQGNITAR